MNLKLRLAVVAFLLGTVSLSWGMLVEISLPELVQKFDIAVVGTLTDVHKTARWGGIVDGTATLAVRDVIFGDTTPGATIPVEWHFMEGSFHSDTSEKLGEHIYVFSLNEGKADDIWPQGIVEVSRRTEIEAATSNPLRMRYRSPAQPNFQVEIGYQNCTSAPLVLPDIAVTSSTLALPAGGELHIKWYDDTDSNTLRIKPGSIASGTTDSQIILQPNTSKYVTVDLANIYSGSLRLAHFNWSLEPYGQSNTVSLLPVFRHSGKVTIEDLYAEPYPLWTNLWVLSKYSPSREIMAGLALAIVGALTAAIMALRRRRRRRRVA